MTQPEQSSRRPVTIAQARLLIACLILYAVYLIAVTALCSGPAGGLFRFLLISVAVILAVYVLSLLSIWAFLLALLAFAALMRRIALYAYADAARQLCEAGDGLYYFVTFCQMIALPAAALIHYL